MAIRSKAARSGHRKGWWLAGLLLVAGVLVIGWQWALPRYVASRLTGTLSAMTGREVTVKHVEVTPWQATVQLEGLRIAGEAGQPPVLASREVDARIAWSSLWHPGWHVERLHFIAPRLRLIWRESGEWNLAQLFAGGDGEKAPLRIDRLTAEQGRFDWVNRRPSRPVTLSLASASLTATGYDSRDAEPMKLDVKADWAGRPFTAEGTLGFAPWQADLAFRVEALPVAVVSRYVAYLTRAEVPHGTLSGRVRLRAGSASSSGTTLTAQGSLADIQATTPDGAPLGRFAHVAVEGVHFDSEASRLTIDAIRLAHPWWQVTIDEALTTNLGAWLPPGGGSGQGQGKGRGLRWSLARLAISDGRVALEDRHLSRPVSLKLAALHGDWTGLGAGEGDGALALDGRVDGESPLRIEGTFQPLKRPLQGDMTLHVEQLALTTLAPYIRRFGGYRIEQGRLTLDAAYRIRDGRLRAETHVALHRLDLGEPVPGQAPDLPARLLVGLLQGDDGVIRFEVPVTIRLDDPELDVGSVMGQAIREALENLVTSPLETLSSVAGGEGDEAGDAGKESPAGADSGSSAAESDRPESPAPSADETESTGSPTGSPKGSLYQRARTRE